MITEKTLKSLRENARLKYEETTPMFKNGKFDPENSRGGDDIIRDYYSLWNDNGGDMKRVTEHVNLDMGNGTKFIGDFISSHDILEDQSYVTVILEGALCDEAEHEREPISKRYYISSYKDRGRTEIFRCHQDEYVPNGRCDLEEDYIFLLNVIESIGFKFDTLE